MENVLTFVQMDILPLQEAIIVSNVTINVLLAQILLINVLLVFLVFQIMVLALPHVLAIL